MKFKTEVYGSLCSLSLFEINGMDADEDEFVNKFDHSRETAPDYGCGDMRADIRIPSDAILEKYGITVDEFTVIAEDVAEKVSFGRCGWCI